MTRRPRTSTLFPYTTLFRSNGCFWPRQRRGPAPGRSWRRSSGRSDRKSTRLNSSHEWTSYAVFCLKKKKDERKVDCRIGEEGQRILRPSGDELVRVAFVCFV